MVQKITHHKHVIKDIDSTNDAIIYYAYPELCKGLQNVSDTCFKPTLMDCYDSKDAYFHYVYMLEELKRAGLIISIHLFPEEANVDVLQCPVFHEASPFEHNSTLVIGKLNDHERKFQSILDLFCPILLRIWSILVYF